MEIRRAADRATSREPGIVGQHCFSWGDHYDPENISFGPLVAANAFDLEPGAGFDMHPHAGVEIVTWVVEGELTHSDSTGATVQVPAGHWAVLGAGDGVEHAERNEGPAPARILQLFFHPVREGAASYRTGSNPILAVPGNQARVWFADRSAGASIDVPSSSGLWALVLAGSVAADEALLETGDELRARPAPRLVRAGSAGARLLLVSLE